MADPCGTGEIENLITVQASAFQDLALIAALAEEGLVEPKRVVAFVELQALRQRRRVSTSPIVACRSDTLF